MLEVQLALHSSYIWTLCTRTLHTHMIDFLDQPVYFMSNQGFEIILTGSLVKTVKTKVLQFGSLRAGAYTLS